jgi:hypothetical protein
MNTQLVYRKKNFTESSDFFLKGVMSTPTFSGQTTTTIEEKKDYVFNMANQCRDWYNPIFVSDSKYLPVTDVVTDLGSTPQEELTALTLQNDGSFKDSSALTIPPNMQKQNLLVDGLIVAGVAIVIFKLLS